MPRYKARVETSFRPEFRPDAHSTKTHRQLTALGFDNVQEVVVGKHIEVEFEAPDFSAALDIADKMAEQLLVNPVSEQSNVFVDALDAPEPEEPELPEYYQGMVAPRYYEVDTHIRALDLSRCGLETGPIKWVQALWKIHGEEKRFVPTIVLLSYTIYGRDMPYKIRMHLDKRCLLDDLDYRGPGMFYQQIWDMRTQWNDKITARENTIRIADHIGFGLYKAGLID